MKNILVGVDVSELTTKVIQQAKTWAKAFDAKLWLIHVASPDPSFVGYNVGPQYIRDARAAELRGEHKYVLDYVERLAAEGVEAEGLMVPGPIGESLLQKARDLNADLIIMGGHKHSYFFELLVGSLWKDLIRRSKVPIVVVPETTTS
jgi:nucleotide-binding universal stress UspA family protein